jgi:prepilin-type N-terminal cleavage/methylation domain-containing protein
MNPSLHRGFTVLELLISLAIGLVAIGFGLSMLLQQNSSLQKASGTGNAMNQNQTAADAISGAIRLAGTGIDASMAFDFDFYDCTLPGTSLSMTESGNCSQRKRDAVDAPDELVVAYRDMSYTTNWTQPSTSRATPVRVAPRETSDSSWARCGASPAPTPRAPPWC